MPSGDCVLWSNGSYYVRHPNGRMDKVSPQQAATYPACAGAAPAPSSSPAMPTRASVAMRGIPRLGNMQSVYTSGPSTDTVPGSNVNPYQGTAVVSQVSQQPTSSPTSVPTSVPTQPPPPPTSTPIPPPRRPPRGISTAPTLTSGVSVVTDWAHPTTVVTFPAPSPPVPDAPPEPSSAATPTRMSSGKTIALVGAGIGLLYLLTRK